MLQEIPYKPFTTKEIEPGGWLYQQLQIQAKSLSGNLDKIWPDIRESKWIGGEKDGWERVPYWLDGFIPLAYLLKNEDMIARAKQYIDGILAGQQEDGWICPCSEQERGRYDMWAMFLICKVLVLYYECSGDERVESAVYRALWNLREHIRGCTIFNWASARWYECLISIYWLYERVKEEWLIGLAVTLYTQGMHYKALFSHWQDQEPRNEWSQQTHVVNLAMALKSEALISRITGEDSNAFAEKMIALLQQYHGTAVGHFTGDECLSGTSPIQGTELCGVTEAMYSYEVLFSMTGNLNWLDRLELLAYNALPAAISPDMWTHQYDQMTNQIACVKFPDQPIFRTNGQESHLFGLEPNFGCCTANFNQGWPKFALSTFFQSKSGIVSAALAPGKVTTAINGSNVSVELETLYPFRNQLLYTVTAEDPVEFDLDIRIPSWVTSALVDGKQAERGTLYRISRRWQGTVQIRLELNLEARFVERPDNLVCLQRGALVYSVSIEEEWNRLEYVRDGVERTFPYCDYELYPKSAWNYAFAGENFAVLEHDSFDLPFSSVNPPIRLSAEMVEIDWGFEDGYEHVCARSPRERIPISEKKRVILHPYGCTNLRMTEMPKL